jgi:hypothetical protein
MVKMVEVTDVDGKPSANPKDIINEFLRMNVKSVKIEESEIGRGDKDINNFLARTRVYLKYHKLDKMVDISRRKPHIVLVKIETEIIEEIREVEENVNGNVTDEENTVDAESAEK